ncbi:hypothetical protein EON77_03600 [bacterium]|nr:MAG: hypothetical protein EON77_03600 [bacterium]
MALPRIGAALGLSIMGSGVLAGCGWISLKRAAVPSVPPRLVVDLGTLDQAQGKPFEVTMPASPALQETLSTGDIQMHCDLIDLRCMLTAPGTVTFYGTTVHLPNQTSFATTASVALAGTSVLALDLRAKVRPAFEISPIVEGERYEIRMAPGVAAPVAVEHTDGLVAKVTPTGTDRAELVLTRERPARVPGGMVRLLDRASGSSRAIALPLPPMESTSTRSGTLVEPNGEMIIGACSALTPDRPDVEVVLDPPGAYEILRRGYVGGKLTLTLRSITRVPADVTVGFRRRGRWVEVQKNYLD